MKYFQYWRQAWPILAICTFYIYLLFHVFNGSQGVMRWVDYEQDIARLEAGLVHVKALREDLELEADQLRTRHLYLEAVDEKAREQAFVSYPNELTIWLDQTP